VPVLHGKRDATRVVRVSLTKRRSRGDSSALIVGHSHRVSDTAPVEGCSDPPMEECPVIRPQPLLQRPNLR